MTIALTNTCGAGQLLKWNGATWMCAADIDTNSGGTITGVTAGVGLTGGGTTGNVTLSLHEHVREPARCLKWNGTTWACANDIDTDTNSGGTITGGHRGRRPHRRRDDRQRDARGRSRRRRRRARPTPSGSTPRTPTRAT